MSLCLPRINSLGTRLPLLKALDPAAAVAIEWRMRLLFFNSWPHLSTFDHALPDDGLLAPGSIPLSRRKNLLPMDKLAMLPEAVARPRLEPPLAAQIDQLAQRIVAARTRASVMMAYGAHLIKNGAGPLVNALVERGLITHLATQGAGVIHDWEFAFQDASGESVRENAPAGRFGSWEETGRWLNLAVLNGAAEGIGFGEAVGRMIVDNGLTIPSADDLRAPFKTGPRTN